jgi:hypothetical protein
MVAPPCWSVHVAQPTRSRQAEEETQKAQPASAGTSAHDEPVVCSGKQRAFCEGSRTSSGMAAVLVKHQASLGTAVTW